MKTLKALVLTLSFMTFGNAHAFTAGDLISPKAQKIALPCIAGMVVSQALGQEPGVGLAICAASATYVMVEDFHNPNQGKLEEGVEAFLKDAKKSLDSSLSHNKGEYLVYQEAVRKIILEKLSEVQGTSEKQIEKYMQSPSFESFLKEKTQAIIMSSDDVVTDRLNKAKEEIRKQITEEVLKDVIDAQVN